MKKFLRYFFILLVLAAISFFLWLYFWPGTKRELFDFVPESAIYVVEADDPVKNWKEFNESAIWNHLRKHAWFGSIDSSARYLDSLVKANENVLSFAGKHPMLISAHIKPGKDDYDFLYLIDLRKGAKISFFTDLILGILKEAGFKYGNTTVGNHEITWVEDSDGEKIKFAFSDNVLIISYFQEFVLEALEQGENPYFSRNSSFLKARNAVSTKGPFRIFVNYPQIPALMKVYSSEENETVRDIAKSLRFTALDLKLKNDLASLAGFSIPNDSAVSMLNAMLSVKGNELNSDEILPWNSSFLLHLGFRNFASLKTGIETALQRDSLLWNEYQESRRSAEKLLKVNFDEDLFSWIGNEISLALVPIDSSERHQAYVAAFHSEDIEIAKEKLGHLLQQLRRRTPLKFKSEEYQGYSINYMEMKGFFKLFFGKFFKKFDKPHFAFLGEYVVFSNDTAALHRCIDAVLSGNVLAKSPGFASFAEEFPSSPNLMVLISMEHLFPWMPELVTEKTWYRMRKNRSWYNSFPHMGFALESNKEYYETQVHISFQPKSSPAP